MKWTMSFYLYANWTPEHNAVIHVGSRGNCKGGKGCHENPLGNWNGRWHGPNPYGRGRGADQGKRNTY